MEILKTEEYTRATTTRANSIQEFSMVRPKGWGGHIRRGISRQKSTHTHMWHALISLCSHTTQKSTILEPYYSLSFLLSPFFLFAFSMYQEREMLKQWWWLDEKLDLHPMSSSNFKVQSLVFITPIDFFCRMVPPSPIFHSTINAGLDFQSPPLLSHSYSMTPLLNTSLPRFLTQNLKKEKICNKSPTLGNLQSH